MRTGTRWRDRFSWLGGRTRDLKSSTSVGIYPEEVYRRLAHREIKRSERSGFHCRMLIVYRPETQKVVVPLGAELLDKIISMLSRSCRDTDVIGWYRQDRMLGVLLTALRPEFSQDGCETLKCRLLARLRNARNCIDDESLEVRVLEPGELTAFNAADDSARFPADSKG
jgi:hypothetical protein